MKPELTIILLLKERQSYTSRFIEYFLKNNLGYNLFISDGSKSKLEPKILNKIKKNSKITYRKFREDKNYKIYYKKILLSLQMVKTKYVCFASNDDFLIYPTLYKCMKILKKDKKLNGAGGTIYNFSLRRDLKSNFYLSDVKPLYLKNNFNQSTKITRVKYFLKIFKSTMHYIMNRKNLIKSYKESSKYFDLNIELKEHFTDLNNIIIGGIKVINSPILFHQATPNSESSKRPNLIINNLSKKNFIEDLIKFSKIISKKIKMDNLELFKEYYNKTLHPIMKNIEFKRELGSKEILNVINKKINRKIFFKKNNFKNKIVINKKVKTIVIEINNFLIKNKHEI